MSDSSPLQVASWLAICLSLAVNLYLGVTTLRQARATARRQAWHDLFAQFDHINDYEQAHDVRVYSDNESGSAAPLLMHHLNLMLRFHVYQRLITREERRGFDRWLDGVFFPWIASSTPLQNDLQRVLTHGDLYPDSFLKWLREHPTYLRVMCGERAV